MVTTTKELFTATALRLFADRGFDATTVGDIEDAAGFTRRGRAFYKHFDSKEAVLDAAVRQYLDASTQLQSASDLLPLGDLRSELVLVCRVALAHIGNEAVIIQLLEREGHRLPKLRRALKATFVDDAHRTLAAMLVRWRPELDDAEATAAVLIGSIVNFRRTAWTFGANPLGLDEDRFVNAWVALAMEGIG